ncbi:MAG: DUF4180 domain-containing protein [Pseudohongiellaceae bacterium]
MSLESESSKSKPSLGDLYPRVDSAEDIGHALSVGLQAGGLLLAESCLGPEFFELRSGLAGELFQKLINYGVRTAIVLPDPTVHGQRWIELAREHQNHNLIRIVLSETEGQDWLNETGG